MELVSIEIELDGREVTADPGLEAAIVAECSQKYPGVVVTVKFGEHGHRVYPYWWGSQGKEARAQLREFYNRFPLMLDYLIDKWEGKSK